MLIVSFTEHFRRQRLLANAPPQLEVAPPVAKSATVSIFDRPRCHFCEESFKREGVDDLFQQTSKQEILQFVSGLHKSEGEIRAHLCEQFPHVSHGCIQRLLRGIGAVDSQPYICSKCYSVVRSMMKAYDESSKPSTALQLFWDVDSGVHMRGFA